MKSTKKLAQEVIQRILKSVKRVINIHDKKTYALKVTSKATIDSQNLIDFLKKEIAVLRSMDHQNIVKLYEVIRSYAKIYLVLEFVQYPDLFSLIG